MRQIWQIFGSHNIRSYFSSTTHRINHRILTDSRNIIYCCPVAKLCLTLCNPMNCKTTGFPVLHFLPEFAQTHVHWFGDAIETSRPLLPPSLLVLNLSQHRVLSSELAHCIKWPKYWNVSISTFNDYSGLLFFRIGWFDLLAVRGTLKCLVQHQNSVTSILKHSAFLILQISHLYVTGKTIALTIWTFVSKVICLLLLKWNILVVSRFGI